MIKTKLINLFESEHKFIILIWFVFIFLAIIFNRTIQFIFGFDVKNWTYSTLKSLLFNIFIYGIVFYIIPIFYTNRKNLKWNWLIYICSFLSILGLGLSIYSRWFNILLYISVVILIIKGYLTNLGFERIKFWEFILLTIFYGILYLIPVLVTRSNQNLTINDAISSLIDRMFLNPASTVEFIFYFGFIGKRLSLMLGKIITPIALGLMYTIHEISNPEYWFENINFIFIPFGIAIFSYIFLWKKNLIPIWIADGIGRFIAKVI